MSQPGPDYFEHRKRLRDRFVKAGLEGFPDYEVVELLPTLAIPRSDVKQPAKALIARFGNLRGILDAPIEEFREVLGIGSVTPVALRIIKAAATLYLQQTVEGARLSCRPGAPCELLANAHRCAFERALRGRVPRLRILRDGIERLEEGTIDRAAVYPRRVVESALRKGAAALVLAITIPTVASSLLNRTRF